MPAPSKRSIYRKIDLALWGDEKFRALSPIPPCGAGLFIYLMTGDSTGLVPGLFSVGRAAMAESLNWALKDFDAAFEEIVNQGMVRADFSARLVWLPNALKYNLPQSPNVVLSWGAPIRRLPECSLKLEALAAMESTLQTALPPAFLQAWAVACGKAGEDFSSKAWEKPSREPSRKAFRKAFTNQEQEKEQEQNQKQEHDPGRGAGEKQSRAPSALARLTNDRSFYTPTFEQAWKSYPNRAGASCKRKAFSAWSARIAEGAQVDELAAGVERYAAYIRAVGNLGTQYVKAPETFFGPDEHFRQNWTPPPLSPSRVAAEKKAAWLKELCGGFNEAIEGSACDITDSEKVTDTEGFDEEEP